MPLQVERSASAGEALPVESDVRAVLVETAVDCLSRFGYRGTTVDRVAKEAGCTKGAVYWHFRDKDALVGAALEHLKERWLEGLQDHLEQLDSAPDKLDRLLDNFLRLVLNERRVCDALQLLALELRRHPKHAGRLRSVFEGTTGLLHEMLARGQREGSIRPDLDPRTLAHAISGSLGGILISCSYGADGLGFGQMVRGLKLTYRRALATS